MIHKLSTFSPSLNRANDAPYSGVIPLKQAVRARRWNLFDAFQLTGPHGYAQLIHRKSGDNKTTRKTSSKRGHYNNCCEPIQGNFSKNFSLDETGPCFYNLTNPTMKKRLTRRSNIRRKRVHGFRRRMRRRGGHHLFTRRRRKGRKILSR